MSEQPEEKKYPLPVSAKFAGGTLLAALPFDLLAHLGPTGLLVGGLASYVAWKHGPEVYDLMRDTLPFLPALEPEENAEKKQGRSFWDRALGRYPDGYQAQEEMDTQQSEPEPDEEPGKKYHLSLGLTFRPHANTVFSNRIVILGMPGSGKSNTVAVIAEELCQYDAPLILFDHKPEYDRMARRPYFTNPLRANVHTVTPETAFEFGQRIMNERLQVVLDLRSYKNDNAAALVMIEIIEGVWAWEEAIDNNHRLPCTFILDEAHYWLPQSEQLSTVSRIKDKQTGLSLFNRLQQAFFNLVNGGRSFGMGIVISTQRPANVDNRAIAVAEWKLLLKANMPNDLKVYHDFGVDADVAMALANGEAYVLGPGDIRGVYQLRKRKSPDDAKTPGVENLARPAAHHIVKRERSSRPTAQQEEPQPPTLAPAQRSLDRSPSVTFDRDVAQPVPQERQMPSSVSAHTLKVIRTLQEAELADHDIAQLVGLTDRDYQRVLAGMVRQREVDTGDHAPVGSQNPYPDEFAEVQPTTTSRNKKPALSPDLQAALDAHNEGLSLREAAARLGVSKATVARRLEKLGIRSRT